MRGVHARASVEWRSRETRETRAATRVQRRETALIAKANKFCVGLITQKYDWLMLEALTTNCQMNNHSYRQDDDGWSIAGMFVMFVSSRDVT